MIDRFPIDSSSSNLISCRMELGCWRRNSSRCCLTGLTSDFRFGCVKEILFLAPAPPESSESSESSSWIIGYDWCIFQPLDPVPSTNILVRRLGAWLRPRHCDTPSVALRCGVAKPGFGCEKCETSNGDTTMIYDHLIPKCSWNGHMIIVIIGDIHMIYDHLIIWISRCVLIPRIVAIWNLRDIHRFQLRQKLARTICWQSQNTFLAMGHGPIIKCLRLRVARARARARRRI